MCYNQLEKIIFILSLFGVEHTLIGMFFIFLLL